MTQCKVRPVAILKYFFHLENFWEADRWWLQRVFIFTPTFRKFIQFGSYFFNRVGSTTYPRGRISPIWRASISETDGFRSNYQLSICWKIQDRRRMWVLKDDGSDPVLVGLNRRSKGLKIPTRFFFFRNAGRMSWKNPQKLYEIHFFRSGKKHAHTHTQRLQSKNAMWPSWNSKQPVFLMVVSTGWFQIIT